MEYLIFGVISGSCLFILPLWAYRKGLNDGLAINQGKSIEPIQNPVQMIVQHKEQKKVAQEDKKMVDGFANLMGYTGDEEEVISK